MSGNRNLKNRIAFSNAIEKSLYETFEELHKKTRIPKSKLFDEAVELLLEKYSKQKEQVHSPNDDRLISP